MLSELDTPNRRPTFAADDWGLSAGINNGILDLARAGALRSVSLLANGAYLTHGLSELLKLRLQKRFVLALHFNITEGPATHIHNDSRLVDSRNYFRGQFALWRSLLLKKINPEHIRSEFLAQWTILTDLGCPIEEINSHHHVHQLPAVYSAIASVLPRGVKCRLMTDPEHAASFWSGRALQKSQSFTIEQSEPLLYISNTRTKKNSKKALRAKHSLLIHPSTTNDLAESRSMGTRRLYDLHFALSFYSDNPSQPYWERKISKWESARYSALSALNPFSLTVRARMKAASRLIANKFSRSHILDLGCGSGILAENVPFGSYCGMDFSKIAIESARSKNIPNAVFAVRDLTNDLTFPKNDLTVMLGLTDWLTPAQVQDLFAALDAPAILFSYTRATNKKSLVSSLYGAYRKHYDTQIKARSFDDEFFEKIRSKNNFTESRRISSRLSPGVLVLWTR